jgi:hypothetical protein
MYRQMEGRAGGIYKKKIDRGGATLSTDRGRKHKQCSSLLFHGSFAALALVDNMWDDEVWRRKEKSDRRNQAWWENRMRHVEGRADVAMKRQVLRRKFNMIEGSWRKMLKNGVN